MCEKAVKSMVKTHKHTIMVCCPISVLFFNSPPSFSNLRQGSWTMYHVSPSMHEDDVGFAFKAQNLPGTDPKRACSAMKRCEIECILCSVFEKEMKGYINFLSFFSLTVFLKILLENPLILE